MTQLEQTNRYFRFDTDGVIDVACGDGRNAIFLAENGLPVDGIDFSESDLKRLSSILRFPLDDVRELDLHVDRILTRSNAKKKRLHPKYPYRYRYICKEIPMDFITDEQPEYNISLSVVIIEITDGCSDNIITNLPDMEFDIEDFKKLYHLRWQEETAFRNLKYPLCLKAFHSKKYEYIEQEVWARAILYNFCSEIYMQVEIDKKDTKLTYQINYTIAQKTCRDFL